MDKLGQIKEHAGRTIDNTVQIKGRKNTAQKSNYKSEKQLFGTSAFLGMEDTTLCQFKPPLIQVSFLYIELEKTE